MRIEKDQVLTAAIVVLLIAAFVVGVIVPGRRDREHLQREVHAAKEQLGINLASSRTLKKWYTQVLDLRKQVQQEQGNVPAAPELAEVLKGLGGALQSHGVTEQELRTREIKRFPQYSVIPISLGFHSQFPVAYGALSEIEGLPRLIRVDRMDLRGDPRKPDQSLDVSLELSTFFSKGGA